MSSSYLGRRAKTSVVILIRFCGLAALSAVSLTGCTSHRAAEPPPVQSSGLVYSPNGEPLSGGALGHPPCSVAMAQWFDRVDANHDGAVDLDEFLGDARRQFAVMDLNHDGIITPGELYAFREPFGQDLVFVPPPGAVDTPHATSAKDSDASSELQHRTTISHDNGPPNRPDPVMAADIKLRFQVTFADFLAYAQDQFTLLNRSHSLRLTKIEVQRSCGAS